MSLEQIRNFSLSNISDAFNNAVAVVKQQPTYIQVLVGLAAATGIGLVGTAFYFLAQKVFGWNATPVAVSADQVAQAETQATLAEKMAKAATAVSKAATDAFTTAEKVATSAATTAQAQKQKIEAAIQLKVVEPVKLVAEEAAGRIASLQAEIAAEFTSLTAAKATLADEAASSSAKSAATTTQNKSVTAILSKSELIKQVDAQYKEKRAEIEKEKNDLVDVQMKIDSENSTIWNPINIAKATVFTGLATVGGLVVTGVIAPFAIPAFVTANVVAGVAAATGVAGFGKLAYDHNKNVLPASTLVEATTSTSK